MPMTYATAVTVYWTRRADPDPPTGSGIEKDQERGKYKYTWLKALGHQFNIIGEDRAVRIFTDLRDELNEFLAAHTTVYEHKRKRVHTDKPGVTRRTKRVSTRRTRGTRVLT